MPFGNPNCRPAGQNCTFAACCTYNGLCPEDWTVPDACYYPYYNYNDRITKEIAIGIGVTVFAFIAITIAVGVAKWFYTHRKSYQHLKDKKSEISDIQNSLNQIEEMNQLEQSKQDSQQQQNIQEHKQEEKKEQRESENGFQKKEERSQHEDLTCKEKKERVINETQNEFLPQQVMYFDL